MKELPCPLCGAKTYTIRYPANLEGAEDAFHYLTEKPCHYQVVDCSVCSLTYSTPIFEENKIVELYRTCSAEQALGPAEDRAITINMRRYLERLQRHSGIRSGRLLDIGCGLGHLLSEAREMGYDAMGIDPSEAAIMEARRRTDAYSVFCGVYSESLAPPGQFDLITLVHVIDHVAEPLRLLKTIQYHLKAGGVAFIATHNIASLLAKLTGENFIAWSIQHISYYTPETLRALAASAGLVPVSIQGSITTYPLAHFASNGVRHPGLRALMLRTMSALSLSGKQFSFPFGNMELIAMKY
jgi:2-polyprenyl-3-methyl-5-hydroxy-6-metoxy-1,4-benzoquinol methylase